MKLKQEWIADFTLFVINVSQQSCELPTSLLKCPSLPPSPYIQYTPFLNLMREKLRHNETHQNLAELQVRVQRPTIKLNIKCLWLDTSCWKIFCRMLHQHSLYGKDGVTHPSPSPVFFYHFQGLFIANTRITLPELIMETAKPQNTAKFGPKA